MESKELKDVFRNNEFVQKLRESKSNANFRRLVFDKIDYIIDGTAKIKCLQCGAKLDKYILYCNDCVFIEE